MNQGLATLAFFGVGVNLVLYLTRVLGQDNADAANNVSKWTGTVYLFSLLGAFLSESYWGRYKTCAIFQAIFVIVSWHHLIYFSFPLTHAWTHMHSMTKIFFLASLGSAFCIFQQCVFFSESCALFTGPANYFFQKNNFKIGSHGTIHIFKNYFTKIFSVFNNKQYPNKHLVSF